MGGIAVVLNVLSGRGVGQSVLEVLVDVLHHRSQGLFFGFLWRRLQRREDGRGDEVGVCCRGEGYERGWGLQRDGGVRVAA